MYRFRLCSIPQRVLGRSLTTYKSSTGIVGLKVDPNGRENLLLVSSNVLDAVKKIPATAAYRTTVEQWFNFITKTAQNHTDIKKIEDEIGLGQIEEVIEMAKDELELVQYYYDNKGWLLVEQAQKEGDAIVEDMADSIYFTTPEMKPPAAAAPQTPPTPPPSTPANAPPKK